MDERGLLPESVRREDVLEFADFLIRPGQTPSGKPRSALSITSQMHTLTTIKKFFQYLGALDLVGKDPTLILPFLKLKKPRRLPRPLHHMDRIALLNGLKIERRKDLETSLAVLLAFQCGFRISELAAIELDRIDFHEKSLSVIGKGDKERVVPLTDQAIDWIQRWYRVREHKTSPFLFPGLNAPFTRHVKPQKINGWLKRAAQWGGLSGHLTVHVLRHTFGTQLAETGATSYEIRDLMGHESILTGETYVRIASEAPRLAHQRAFGTKKNGAANHGRRYSVPA